MTASWTVSRNLSTQSKACQKRNVVVPKRQNGRSRHSWRIYPREKAKLHNLTTKRNSSFVNNTRQLLSVRVFSVPAKRSAVTNSTNKQTFRNLRHFEIRKGICKLVPKHCPLLPQVDSVRSQYNQNLQKLMEEMQYLEMVSGSNSTRAYSLPGRADRGAEGGNWGGKRNDGGGGGVEKNGRKESHFSPPASVSQPPHD